MRLFLTLMCCLAIPLVAHAADQNNKTKKKQTTQNQQPQPQQQQQRQQRQQRQQQPRTQGQHLSANTPSQLNNPSHVKSHSQRYGLNAEKHNVPVMQSNTRQKVATKHHDANTASQLNNSSHVKGHSQRYGLNAEKHSVPVMQSNTRQKVATKHHDANRAAQLNNLSRVKDQKHPQTLNAQNSNLPVVQSNTRVKAEARHFNLSHQANSTVQSATFNQNYRIQGSENWRGQQYAAFQNYRGEWHDQGWWQNHYNRIVLISGGWYFWDAGYWAPAWGYNSSAAYYPYNGPIYAYNNLPPDQVIANVQSTLQAQGYYRGEVDGLLGPMTRAALANYQGDHGLYTTEAIDEPTLRSLGMS